MTGIRQWGHSNFSDGLIKWRQHDDESAALQMESCDVDLGAGSDAVLAVLPMDVVTAEVSDGQLCRQRRNLL